MKSKGHCSAENFTKHLYAERVCTFTTLIPVSL